MDHVAQAAAFVEDNPDAHRPPGRPGHGGGDGVRVDRAGADARPRRRARPSARSAGSSRSRPRRRRARAWPPGPHGTPSCSWPRPGRWSRPADGASRRIHSGLERIVHAAGRGARSEAIRRASAALPAGNFSRDILQSLTPALAVTTLTGVTWWTGDRLAGWSSQPGAAGHRGPRGWTASPSRPPPARRHDSGLPPDAAGPPLSPRSHLGRGRRQFRACSATTPPGSSCASSTRRSRAPRSTGSRWPSAPTRSGTSISRKAGPGSSTGTASTAPTSRRPGTASTRASCSSIPTPRRSPGPSSGATPSSATGSAIPTPT